MVSSCDPQFLAPLSGPEPAPRIVETPGVPWPHQSTTIAFLSFWPISGPWLHSWASDTFRLPGSANTYPLLGYKSPDSLAPLSFLGELRPSCLPLVPSANHLCCFPQLRGYSGNLLPGAPLPVAFRARLLDQRRPWVYMLQAPPLSGQVTLTGSCHTCRQLLPLPAFS